MDHRIAYVNCVRRWMARVRTAMNSLKLPGATWTLVLWVLSIASAAMSLRWVLLKMERKSWTTMASRLIGLVLIIYTVTV
jgi:hypothetical protein